MAALALSLSMSGHADAATIERYSDPVMGCTLLLSGPIVEGDAERLQQQLSALERENPLGSENGRGRLCLNSPGGSFREGVRLAQRIRRTYSFGTAIARGHTCESACAIVFMAGGENPDSEGVFRARPLMHPQSTLGFHAPSIEIPSGQYSERQVTQAWNVALRAVAEIVAMRSGASDDTLGVEVIGGYDFSDQLFLRMLMTPPDSMYYIDTVEKAVRYDIAVYPVGLNAERPVEAFGNLCVSADTPGFGYSDGVPIIRSPTPNQAVAFFREGFRAEGMSSCRVTVALDRLRDRNNFLHLGGRQITIEYGGDERGGGEFVYQAGANPYMSYHPSTRLDQLPTDIEGSWLQFISRVQASATPAAPSFGSCWLTSPTARIINVSSYVNLRRRPEFSATVIREVPLGEQVRVLTPNSNTLVSDRNNACRNACQSYWRNPNDRQARDRVQQCINDNILWYEITDARGNRGWVSRRFLEEAQR